MGQDRLVIGMVATSQKYRASGLRPVVLSEDRTGETATFDSATEGAPYPMVGGTDLYGRDFIVPLTIKGKNDQMYFPEAVVSVSRDRNIVATPVLNGKGTVKEMITDGDLKVSISLAVVSTSKEGDYDGHSTRIYDTYPYKGVERLRKLLDEPERLDIVSPFLERFDLDGGDFGIVVESYSVKQDTSSNRQVVEITALSDYDYNLIVES